MSKREYTEQEIVDVLPHPMHPAARSFKGKSKEEIREFAISILDNKEESMETKVLNDDEFLQRWSNMTLREATKYPNIKRARRIISERQERIALEG
ncbi:hypothetical protein LCGC14_0758120 [marine sediment metagenome]|uniref:Uncharacterized protein n=1 Tax=marine sediment metagenome TaxID=412755 RepID=A0A0F9Q221_9ZZZZ